MYECTPDGQRQEQLTHTGTQERGGSNVRSARAEK